MVFPHLSMRKSGFVFEQPLPPALGFTAVAEAWMY